MAALVQLPYEATVKLALASLERNHLPDVVIRRLTRLLLAARLRSGYKPSVHLQLSDLLRFINSLKEMPIAIKTDEPKAQNYELPTSFFNLVLGQNFKYSCCYFEKSSSTLEEAEKAMLEMYCEKSKLEDGQTVLDVGCGWGSLSLYIAQKYKNCKVTGICNSSTQKDHIDQRCRELGVENVEIIVANISTFEVERSFHRIYSIGMFEVCNIKNFDFDQTNYIRIGSLLE
ncbi:hypothetical protein F8388_022744 [Cannabis sativa]|uniref:Coclaurine N-methyltransferase n=1 Tax=Cannabis sativa TaxID=3483 RepID=A0A7J6E100_CANSA|nr:hypothetical protein F8388_022744 [Cannabis sativa]